MEVDDNAVFRVEKFSPWDVSQADAVFKALDDAMRDEPGYDKTKFRIDFTMNGQPDNYEGRQDFGDGDGCPSAGPKHEQGL